ncbi:soluble guanylate cyclase 88E isoform X2 [Eurytemora carolleeae]|uniref:soluble guanylate cyclase 88E isoform X2 n=1 Tax=Eurytemora carolleeae TaxID=1294199 RepID=UPI000C762C44|nr:soluble guanylate cyclase 88E isoform X2 [Eurytemora carolleeae]|eukprot:XP_023325301.1 soluble guanylate cyclase 88E-like isoform X2 [Eurytemora affinis]
MYGLILQNMVEYIRNSYGEKQWKEIKTKLDLAEDDFGISEQFPEGQISKMGKAAMKVIGVKSVGRNFRDFFVNLDNLHDYLKFTFQRMKAPSFFIAHEDESGMVLEYRSKRRGFHHYVQGQVKEISKNFADEIKKLEITLKKQEVVFDTVVSTFEMKFVNQGYKDFLLQEEQRKVASMPLRASILFEMFPFCILYNSDLTVSVLGSALRQIIPKMVGQNLTNWFELIKPLVEFKWEVIMSRMNSMFELASQEEIDKLCASGGGSTSGGYSSELNHLLDEDVDKTLHIKGQMIFIPEWNSILFLACPMMKDLNNLIWSGLFINDLSMHDYSRDIMLSKTQEQIELKMALVNAEIKAQGVAQQKQKLDAVMKKTQDIIDQMLPKQIAAELAQGKSNMEVCQSYELVTMLFSDIVTFTVICSRLKPLQVVALLNNMYTLFDFLCDQNAVYKVETIGDAYLIVAGCPVKANNHALRICDMAFDMMDGISMMKDPGTGADIEMRIGCHSGPVIAGVVGLKMPRYCLFGVNVGLTEKFESNSKPMRIHISETCQKALTAQYKVEERNDPGLKEKVGGYRSFFLNEKEGRKRLPEAVIKALMPTDKEMPKVEKPAEKKEKAEKTATATNKEPAKAPEARTKEVEATPSEPSKNANPGSGGDKNNNNTTEAEETSGKKEALENEAAPVNSGKIEESSAIPNVETVAQNQCCGGLERSAVCSIL